MQLNGRQNVLCIHFKCLHGIKLRSHCCLEMLLYVIFCVISKQKIIQLTKQPNILPQIFSNPLREN